MKRIIVVSGPVGAGKSTVSKELVAITPEPVACIEGDLFWTFIAKNDPMFGMNHNFRVCMGSMVASALPFAMGGYEVILDFSIPPYFLDRTLKMAQRREIPLDYVVLRPSLSICASRAASRAEGAIADYSDYNDFYDSFDEVERYTIKDDEADPATMAARIREGLDAGVFRVL